MPKYAKWVLFIMAFSLLFIAINIQVGWLFVLDFMLLSFLFTAWVFPRIALLGRINMEVYAQPVFEGEILDVLIRAENFSRVNKYFLSIEEKVLGISLFLPFLPRKNVVEMTYKTKAGVRGVYSLRDFVLKSIGPGGFFEFKRKIACKGRIIIYPSSKSFTLPTQTSSPVPLISEKGVVSGRGDGEEFAGIREYLPGDSLRSVHWSSSAKTGKLMIREMMKVHPFLYTLYLDQDQRWAGSSFETSVKHASYAVQEIFKLGHWVRIFQKGTAELKSLQGNLEILAEIQPDSSLSLSEQVKKDLSFLHICKDLLFFTGIPNEFLSESWKFVNWLLEEGARITFVFSEGKKNEASTRLSSWLGEKGVYTVFGD